MADKSTREANTDFMAEAGLRLWKLREAELLMEARSVDPALQNPVTREATDHAIVELEAAKSMLEQELGYRQALEDAYVKDPTGKAKDSPVPKALDDLKRFRNKNKPFYADRSDLVADACYACIVKELKEALRSNSGIAWERYHHGGGPGFDGVLPLSRYDKWDRLTKSGAITEEQRRVLEAVSRNEGAFDGVNGYDNQALTAGVMQKTIDQHGHGQLSEQLLAFQAADPAAYKELFADKGWTVQVENGKATAYYQEPGSTMTPITGKDLYDYIRKPDDPGRWEATAGVFVQAGADPRFQDQQATDFAADLGAITRLVPSGYSAPVDQYLSSQYGQALMVDQHVNSPNNTEDDIKTALDQFYQANPGAPRDPTQWTAEQRSTYESQIVDDYRALRDTPGHMNDGPRRSGTLAKDTSLSHAPGSATKLPDPPKPKPPPDKKGHG